MSFTRKIATVLVAIATVCSVNANDLSVNGGGGGIWPKPATQNAGGGGWPDKDNNLVYIPSGSGGGIIPPKSSTVCILGFCFNSKG